MVIQSCSRCPFFTPPHTFNEPEEGLAAMYGGYGEHIPLAKLLVDRAVQGRGEKPFTLLAVRLAPIYKHVDMLRYLLDIEADLGTLSHQLRLVEFAVNEGRMDLVQMLLERGVGVAHQRLIDLEWTPAGSAPREGPAMVELAVGQLDVDGIAKTQGDVANFLLHVGAQHGLEWLVVRLLRSGCDPSMTLLPVAWIPRSRPGELVEALATWTGISEIVRLLLAAGTRKDGVLKGVLIDAICGGHVRVVKLLLDHGIDPDTMDIWGFPVLELAIQHEETIHLLVDRGVAIAGVPRLMGQTIAQGKPSQVQRLLDGEYPLEGFLRESVLEVGARNGPEMLQFLFTQGVRADPSSVDDKIPFEFAIQEGHTAVVQALLDRGFDANSLTSHCRPLQLVYLNDQDDNEPMFDLLIRYGADVNATTPDKNNKPILTYHINVNDTGGADEATRLLLKKGASPLMGDPIRRAPLATAARLGQYRTVELLLDAIPNGGSSLVRFKQALQTADDANDRGVPPSTRALLDDAIFRIYEEEEILVHPI